LLLAFFNTVEAGLVADVALAGVNGYFEDEAVLVAIDEYLFYLLKMAALFTLFPYSLPGPAEVCGIAGSNRQIKRSAIHIADHQYLAGLRILGYGGYQAIVAEFWSEFQSFFDFLLCCHFVTPLTIFYLLLTIVFLFNISIVNIQLSIINLPVIICENKSF